MMDNFNGYKIGDYVQFLTANGEYKGKITFIDREVITLFNKDLGEAEIRIEDIIF